jgi:hypothetical protein
MPYTTINKSTDYFNTKLYTGNGGSQSITGVGFKPDWLWVKNRSSGQEHYLADIVRGVTKDLQSNSQGAEATSTNLTSFDTDGFTVASSDRLTQSGSNLVSWNWLAGGSQGSSNTDGTINTTYTSVSSTAGFSISKYNGTGSAATVGHGCGAVPSMIIVKNLTSSSKKWRVYHKTLGGGSVIYLSEAEAAGSGSGSWNNTTPTSSVFSVGTSLDTNESGSSMIAYSFVEKIGYSKFGKYVGNGNNDGTFVFCGFKPAFVMRKSYSSGHTGNWLIHDNKRSPFNEAELQLSANADASEETSTNYNEIDILSNGFKMRGSGNWSNGSGRSYIYMAFAEAPLVGSNNVPCTAR